MEKNKTKEFVNIPVSKEFREDLKVWVAISRSKSYEELIDKALTEYKKRLRRDQMRRINKQK